VIDLRPKSLITRYGRIGNYRIGTTLAREFIHNKMSAKIKSRRIESQRESADYADYKKIKLRNKKAENYKTRSPRELSRGRHFLDRRLQSGARHRRNDCRGAHADGFRLGKSAVLGSTKSIRRRVFERCGQDEFRKANLGLMESVGKFASLVFSAIVSEPRAVATGSCDTQNVRCSTQLRLDPVAPARGSDTSRQDTPRIGKCFSDRLYGANFFRYSIDEMNALTISALMKLPLNWFSFASQKS
jgi:predicted DNA-binding WGR domain protein